MCIHLLLTIHACCSGFGNIIIENEVLITLLLFPLVKDASRSVRRFLIVVTECSGVWRVSVGVAVVV